ncbi:MAG TPA: hypothetical protein VGB15_14795 [Longimicrobium sp.]|jgi:hypothetical protein
MSTQANDGSAPSPATDESIYPFPLGIFQPLSDTVQQVVDIGGTGSELYIGTGRVGIGTATPEMALVVQSVDTMVQLQSQSGEASMEFINTDGVHWHLGSGGGQGAGPGAFFLWNNVNAFSLVATATALQLFGAVAMPNLPSANSSASPGNLCAVLIDPQTGQLYVQ